MVVIICPANWIIHWPRFRRFHHFFFDCCRQHTSLGFPHPMSFSSTLAVRPGNFFHRVLAYHSWLMVQKSRWQTLATVWMYIKNHVNNGITYQPQLVSWIFSINITSQSQQTWDDLFCISFPMILKSLANASMTDLDTFSSSTYMNRTLNPSQVVSRSNHENANLNPPSTGVLKYDTNPNNAFFFSGNPFKNYHRIVNCLIPSIWIMTPHTCWFTHRSKMSQPPTCACCAFWKRAEAMQTSSCHSPGSWVFFVIWVTQNDGGQ